MWVLVPFNSQLVAMPISQTDKSFSKLILNVYRLLGARGPDPGGAAAQGA